METKQCPKCNTRKPMTAEFFFRSNMSKSGFQNKCKVCCKEHHSKWVKENKEKNLSYHKNRKKDESEKPPKVYLSEEERRERNRQYARDYQRKRRQDPMYRMRGNIGMLVMFGLKRTGNCKKGQSVFEKLPYTTDELKEHLEKQFDDKMNWDNYGSYWHVDHIYPQSLLPFDSFDHPNFLKCWRLENLQPLEKIENIRKSNKVL